MGLDMHLYSFPKIEGMNLAEVRSADIHLRELEKENGAIYEKIKEHIKHFEEFDFSWRGLRTEIATWRKANQIHHWFVETVQNGKDDMCSYEVSKEQLQELYNACVNVLLNRKISHKVLPTRPGPFFGSTSYDQYYYWKIERTKTIIENLLINFNFETHYMLYCADW
jgi:hypothetical protein